MTSRSDVYLTTIAALVLLAVGLTILITGTITSPTVGPVIITGTITTTAGALATLAAGYRAAQHHTREHVNHRAAALVRDIVAHDRAIAADLPDRADVVPFTPARRQQRESNT
ncbi:hypothetical protein [Streptomyces pseudogriseolus]|uniref:hypothetical protein n=1 Tax=Streptomyces pseudogriseolus TaxID=36817 RepID=UPI003FA1D81A